MLRLSILSLSNFIQAMIYSSPLYSSVVPKSCRVCLCRKHCTFSDFLLLSLLSSGSENNVNAIATIAIINTVFIIRHFYLCYGPRDTFLVNEFQNLAEGLCLAPVVLLQQVWIPVVFRYLPAKDFSLPGEIQNVVQPFLFHFLHPLKSNFAMSSSPNLEPFFSLLIARKTFAIAPSVAPRSTQSISSCTTSAELWLNMSKLSTP